MYHVEAKNRLDILCMNFHDPFYGKYLKRYCDAFFSMYNYLPDSQQNFEWCLWARSKYKEYLADGTGEDYFDNVLKNVRVELIDYTFHRTPAVTRVTAFVYIQRLTSPQLIPCMKRLLELQLERMKEYKTEHPDEKVQIGQIQIYCPYITKQEVFTTDGRLTDIFSLVMKAHEADRKTARKLSLCAVDRHELIRRWRSLMLHDNPTKTKFPIRHYYRYFTRRTPRESLAMAEIQDGKKQI